MFDIGWQELFIVGLLALVVVGPKDLPRVLRTVTGMIRKVKGMAREFQSGIDDVVRESELQDMRKELEGQGQDMREDVIGQIDPTGDLSNDLDFSDEKAALEAAAVGEDDPAADPALDADQAARQKDAADTDVTSDTDVKKDA